MINLSKENIAMCYILLSTVMCKKACFVSGKKSSVRFVGMLVSFNLLGFYNNDMIKSTPDSKLYLFAVGTSSVG